MQEERDRRIARAGLAIGHLGIEHGKLGQVDVIHGHGSLNTVMKTMRLKRSSGSALRSTFMRRMAPCQEESRNSARSCGAKVSAISPAASASSRSSPNGAHTSPHSSPSAMG